MSSYVYGAYKTLLSWVHSSSASQPSNPEQEKSTKKIDAIAQISLKSQIAEEKKNEEIPANIREMQANIEQMQQQLDALKQQVKLPLELAMEQFSKDFISFPLPLDTDFLDALQKFRKEPDYFSCLLSADRGGESKKAFSEFYKSISALETHYATSAGKKDFQKHMEETFSIRALMYFLLCDGLHELKSQIAPIALKRILKLNEGKFPLPDFQATLKPNVYFLRRGQVEALLQYCPNVSKEDIAKLYHYSHPSNLIKSSGLPQLTPKEHVEYTYGALLGMDSGMFAFWLNQSDSAYDKMLLQQFLNQTALDFPTLNKALREKSNLAV